MKFVQYTCDLCGEEVKEEGLGALSVKMSYGGALLVYHGMGDECCAKCADALKDYLENEALTRATVLRLRGK